MVLANLVFGATLGLTHGLVLRRALTINVPALWIVTAMLGCMIGARAGIWLAVPQAIAQSGRHKERR